MNNEVPGISIPGKILERMRRADSKEAALREGIAIAGEMVRQVKEHVAGIQVSAPFGKIRYALDVISVLHENFFINR